MTRLFGGETPASAARSSTLSSSWSDVGKDPFAYFEWVFGKLMHNPGPDKLPELLPAAWIKSQAQPARAEARAVA